MNIVIQSIFRWTITIWPLTYNRFGPPYAAKTDSTRPLKVCYSICIKKLATDPSMSCKL